MDKPILMKSSDFSKKQLNKFQGEFNRSRNMSMTNFLSRRNSTKNWSLRSSTVLAASKTFDRFPDIDRRRYKKQYILEG